MNELPTDEKIVLGYHDVLVAIMRQAAYGIPIEDLDLSDFAELSRKFKKISPDRLKEMEEKHLHLYLLPDRLRDVHDLLFQTA